MTDPQVQEIKQKTDIVALISERIQLKKAGRNYKGLCPFHGEKSPSFFVSAEMQIYKCFGCQAAGDVLNFVQDYDGLTFREALEVLAKRAGVELSDRKLTSEESRRQKHLEALHLAAEYYHYLLTEHAIGERARNYLRGRGVLNQSIKDFMIGYAPDSWDGIYKFLVGKKGFRKEDLVAVGLSIEGKSGRPYDRFRGRIIFPLRTYSGNIVGFSGRVLEADAKEAKYINSPETDLYHKSEMLYGLFEGKRTVRQQDRVVVVEGELDVISSHQIGLGEVVAVKGSALTDEQVGLVRRLTRNLILALDADEAGQEAIKRGIEVSERQGMNLKVVRIPEGKDPDELARKSARQWKDAVEQAESIYSYYIESAFKRFDAKTGLGQKSITEMVVPILTKITNGVEQAYYMKLLAQRLGVQERVVAEEVSKAERLGGVTVAKTKIETTRSISRRERVERYLVSLILQFEDDFQAKLQEVELKWFGEAYIKRLLEGLNTVGTVAGVRPAIEQLQEELQPLAYELYAADLGLLESTRDEREKLLAKTIGQLKSLWAKQELITISRRLSEDLPETEMLEVQAQYRALRNLVTPEDSG